MMVAIEKGVPIPPKHATTEAIFPFADMVPGDCFAWPLQEGQDIVKLRQRLTSAAASWSKRHAPGAKFTTRVELDGKGVRIWMLTRPAPLAPIRVGELPVAKVHKLADDEADPPRARRASTKPPMAFDIPSFAAGGKAHVVKGSRY